MTLSSTGRGILLTSLTTSAAFGTMMGASYKGFASFGLVLVLGIAIAYLATVVLVPAILTYFDERNS